MVGKGNTKNSNASHSSIWNVVKSRAEFIVDVLRDFFTSSKVDMTNSKVKASKAQDENINGVLVLLKKDFIDKYNAKIDKKVKVIEEVVITVRTESEKQKFCLDDFLKSEARALYYGILEQKKGTKKKLKVDDILNGNPQSKHSAKKLEQKISVTDGYSIHLDWRYKCWDGLFKHLDVSNSEIQEANLPFRVKQYIGVNLVKEHVETPFNESNCAFIDKNLSDICAVEPSISSSDVYKKF